MRSLMALVAAASLATAVPAMAGFVATTGPDTLTNINVTADPGAQPGDGFSLLNGTFSSYVPQGSGDPQIAGDLGNFGYQMLGTVQSVAGNVVSYTGSYVLFYDLNNDNAFTSGADTSVSAGDFTLQATFASGNTAGLSGLLTQTSGPSGPFASNFADFGARYGGTPLSFAGLYTGVGNGDTGLVSGTLSTDASPVPVPAAAVGGLVLSGLLGLKRRRA